MIYQQLGKSPLIISRIGFGCMSLQTNNQENEILINRALEYGINFFDTADIYEAGMNETRIGNILKSKRKDLLISTKVGNRIRPDGKGLDWAPSKKYILAAAEESLRRLDTDYIDLYQLHGGTIEDPMDEIIEAFEILQKQGKIRCYGISSIRPNIIRAYVKIAGISSVMMQYSLLDRRPAESCLDLLLKNNIGVLARGSIAKGLLVNKPAIPFLGYSETDVQLAKDAIAKISGNRRSPAETAVSYALHHPAITSVVAGIRTLNQLEDLAGAANKPLSAAEMHYLEQSIPANQYDQHV